MVKILLITLLRAYRFFLSPWIGQQCRFTPTCSQYAIEAIERHGALHGLGLVLRRVGRCHPWCQGGVDAVPRYLPESKVPRANSFDCTRQD